MKTLTIRYYDFDKKESVEMTVPTDCVEIKILPQTEVYAEAVSDGSEEPFGGSHAPDCPYRLKGECNCWRSDPEQNPEARDADGA